VRFYEERSGGDIPDTVARRCAVCGLRVETNEIEPLSLLDLIEGRDEYYYNAIWEYGTEDDNGKVKVFCCEDCETKWWDEENRKRKEAEACQTI